MNMPRGSDAVRNFRVMAGDFTNPILKPEAAAQVRHLGEISLGGVNFPDPANQCWPYQPPYIFPTVVLQILQEARKVTILYQGDHQYRQVRLNDRHPVPLIPSWYGDSVGRYDGDTLVVDTVGIKKASPFSMVDRYGTPHSGALHIVERYRLIDGNLATEAAERNERVFGYVNYDMAGPRIDRDYRGKGLQLQFTVEDPGVFTMSWSAVVTYRVTNDGWDERVCADNPHNYITGNDTPVPTARTPDF